jgi:alkylation response protein AidB-like acyl-CoA dehydrogenase
VEASLSEDQVLIVETAARLAEQLACPAPTELPLTDDDLVGWEMLTETGFASMHVGGSHGGGDAHSADVALVAEQLAITLSCVPYLGQGVLAPELAWRLGAAPALLNDMAGGSQRVTIALDPTLRSIGRVGQPGFAWDARGATHALAFDSTEQLCVVALQPGIARGADITRVLRPVASDASFEVLTGPADAAAVARFEAFALAMLAADLVGVMQSAVDAAVDYVKSRVQFGVAVGTFQAVQHLAADAKVLLEGARSSMWFAAWAADELDVDAALLAARQAKAYASRVALEVVELQVQLFGGIAITWEERAHVRVRRVLLDALTLGDTAFHEDAIAAARLEVGI